MRSPTVNIAFIGGFEGMVKIKSRAAAKGDPLLRYLGGLGGGAVERRRFSCGKIPGKR